VQKLPNGLTAFFSLKLTAEYHS